MKLRKFGDKIHCISTQEIQKKSGPLYVHSKLIM